MFLSGVFLVFALGSPPADSTVTGADYGAHEDVSCRKRARPKYPRELQRRGIGGTATFRVSVDAGNRFLGAVVYTSSGHPALDAAGLAVLSQWCFRAGREAGKPIGGDVLVPIRFRP